MNTHVLLVEDDEQMREFLRMRLVDHAFAVVAVSTLREAARAVAEAPPALVLLDLGLPDGDGVDLIRQLRGWTRVPIVVLTARGQEGDRLAVFEAGADDYLTKPFGVRELFERIRGVLRPRGDGPPDSVHVVGPIRVDEAAGAVTVAGAPVSLTPIELRLLVLLVRQPGRLWTHAQLLGEICGPNAVRRVHYLRVQMTALRRKIEADPARPAWLIAEPGVGYRLRAAGPDRGAGG